MYNNWLYQLDRAFDLQVVVKGVIAYTPYQSNRAHGRLTVTMAKFHLDHLLRNSRETINYAGYDNKDGVPMMEKKMCVDSLALWNGATLGVFLLRGVVILDSKMEDMDEIVTLDFITRDIPPCLKVSMWGWSGV